MEPVQSPGLELLHTFNRLLASPPSGTALDYLGLLQSDSDSEPCDDVFSIFSEINEDPDLLVRLMTMGQVGKSRPALSSMTLYWQRRYADAKRRLLAAVALETEGYVFTFVYYPKARTFDVCVYSCLVHSRYSLCRCECRNNACRTSVIGTAMNPPLCPGVLQW